MQSKKIFLITLLPETHRTSEENLGIEYLKSSLIKANYNVEIIDAWLNEYSVDDVYKEIYSNKDNLLFIGISSYMSNTRPTIDLIKLVKNDLPDIKVVCGGFGPTFYPDDYLNNKADYVIRGEGEEAICELADCIVKDDIPVDIKNISYKDIDGKIVHNQMRNLMSDIDNIPFPSRDCEEVVKEKKSSTNMLSSRGCSGNCDFCSVISFFRQAPGKVWRTRSIDNIVDEIELLAHKGVNYIKMVDDSFVDGCRDSLWVENFADEIEKRNINVKLRGQIRADKVSDDILFNLKRAGFFSFACGIENGSESALLRMNKAASLDDNIKALELFKKYNYYLQMGFILFDDKTTLQELEDNYYFLEKYDFAITKGIFSEMYSAEGTKFNEKLKKRNNLFESDFLDNNNKYSINNFQVSVIYESLKKWHKSHSEIYDMTIDPLIAPKDITSDSQKELYEKIMDLKKQDLMVFKKLLQLVKTENNVKEFNEYINYKIDSSNDFYNDSQEYVKKIYKKERLEYKGVSNPFI